MKIDEKEFRSFIANVDKYTDNSCFNGIQSDLEPEEYQILKNKLFNQLLAYIKILETPKPSKWKQLKLIDGDTHIEKI